MYQSVEIFRTSADMARHAGARQALTSRNVAYADTPGYTATHMVSFKDAVELTPATQMRATRPGHISPIHNQYQPAVVKTSAEPSPNGNSVSIEEEMMQAVANQREHNRALAIYRHGLTILRSTLGK